MTEALTQRNRRLERELEEQQQHCAALENDLLNAVDDLRREQDGSRDFVREIADQVGF